MESDQLHVPAICFSDGKRLNPRTSMSNVFWFFTSIFFDGLPVRFSQSALWSELSFRYPHENEHWFTHVAFVMSLDCACVVGSLYMIS